MPSDLRKYIEFNAKLRKEYGSVMSYILKVRLGWDDLTPQNSTPFASTGRRWCGITNDY